jgi:hypothetical protein
MFSQSFVDGRYPSDFEHAVVTPIAQFGNNPMHRPRVLLYRPIDNLAVLSTIFERYFRSVSRYFDQAMHSTKLHAVLRILSHLLAAAYGTEVTSPS